MSASLALLARLVSVLYSRPFRSLPVPVKQRVRLPAVPPERRTDVELGPGILPMMPPDRDPRAYVVPGARVLAAAPLLPGGMSVGPPDHPWLPAGKTVGPLSAAVLKMAPPADRPTSLRAPDRAVARVLAQLDAPGPMTGREPVAIGAPQRAKVSRPGRLSGLADAVSGGAGAIVPLVSPNRAGRAGKHVLPPTMGMRGVDMLPAAVTSLGRGNAGLLPGGDATSRTSGAMQIAWRGATPTSVQSPKQVAAAQPMLETLSLGVGASNARGVLPLAASVPPPVPAAGLRMDNAQFVHANPPPPMPLRGRDSPQSTDAAARPSAPAEVGMTQEMKVNGGVHMSGRQLGRTSADVLARDASLPLNTQSRPNIRTTNLYTGMRIPQ